MCSPRMHAVPLSTCAMQRDVDLLELSWSSSVLKLTAIGDKVGLWSHFFDFINNIIWEDGIEKNSIARSGGFFVVELYFNSILNAFYLIVSNRKDFNCSILLTQ